MLNFPAILFILLSLFINKYHNSIFMISLFTLLFHGRVPVSPLIPYNIKFVQRGFTERAVFEERIPRVGRGFAILCKCVILFRALILMISALIKKRDLRPGQDFELFKFVCVL
jgi:hypothetical protein